MRSLSSIPVLIISLLVTFLAIVLAGSPETGPSNASEFYTLIANDSRNQLHKFSQYKGKVVLIVNVASKCGFASQYEGLQGLYKKYKDQGLEILGFPCNQFGNKEPGSLEDINSFCILNYGVSFPIMEKVEVNGDNVHPVYEWLKSQKSGILGMNRIKWNFEKFLVGRDGNVINRWSSIAYPETLEMYIKNALSVVQ